jgi:N-acetylmuramoyl-L-alanine amidase
MPDFDIKFHRLIGDNVTREETPNGSGPCNPRFIVMHYTATKTADEAVRTFKSRKSKASSHLIIDLDGSVISMQAFNRVTWHAGPSAYKGFTSLNHHSIGIEIVNTGFLRRTNDQGMYRTWSGQYLEERDFVDGIEMVQYPKAGSGDLFWPRYTHEQLATLDEIVPLLLSRYPILDIVGHEDIDTRGWKVDPGPVFPMARYKAFLDDRSSDVSDPLIPAKERGLVTASSLNVRSGPSIHSEKISEALKKTPVIIIGSNRDWYEVLFNKDDSPVRGWVHSDFVRRV